MIRLSLLLALLAGACLGLAQWPAAVGTAPWLLLAKSFGFLLALSVFHALSNRLTAGLNSGHHAWQRTLRSRLGLEPGEKMREATWLKWSTLLLIWGAAPLLILQWWGLGQTSRDLLDKALRAGIPVGEVQIVPAKILFGIMMVALLITLIRTFTARLEHGVLARTPMDPAVRESVATLIGYVAIAIAVIFALNVAGVDLSKMAFIVGALGVGIGFGLQNIVNNFVSGLIILFERPIRTGDYITIGGNEGFVRKIRIRATEMETLDHQHLIIPNSLYISEPVTNWSLRDPYLRITVPVGVAYGSDTELVKRLLLQVAHQHPLVLGPDQSEAPAPVVQFSSFGDNSLNFELKIYVREVAKRYMVRSDINFALDAAFREHKVNIPFPQRELWFRNELPLQAAEQNKHET